MYAGIPLAYFCVRVHGIWALGEYTLQSLQVSCCGSLSSDLRHLRLLSMFSQMPVKVCHCVKFCM